MKLSPLEIDLLGDLAQDDHGAWEVFEFVRLHYPDAGEDEVFHRGTDILSIWLHRGWVRFATSNGVSLDSSDAETWINDLVPAMMTASQSVPWIRLTELGERDYQHFAAAT